MHEGVTVARLAYFVRHEDGSRFPESGWLDGTASDLADLIRLVSVPQKAVEQAAETLERGIGQAANRLEEMAKLRPNVTPVIARLLGMGDVPQTRRMACAIIANAMVFHQRIAGMHEGVKSLHLVCGPDVTNPQGETLSVWAAILKINYWPIFAIAKDILEQIPGNTAASILRELLDTAQGVESTFVFDRYCQGHQLELYVMIRVPIARIIVGGIVLGAVVGACDRTPRSRNADR